MIGAPATLAPYVSFPVAQPLQRVLVIFNLDREANLPSWFSSVLLFVAGCVLVMMAGLRSKYRGRWAFLAAAFFYVSMDETATVHERLNALTAGLNLPGAFHFGWLVFASPILIAMAAGYWSLLRSLPARTRSLSFAAAALYLGGAVGMEMISGAWAAAHGTKNLTYAALTIPEEALEMAGVIVWIAALLVQLQYSGARLVFGSPGERLRS